METECRMLSILKIIVLKKYYIIFWNSDYVEVTRAGLAGVPNLALRPLELSYTFTCSCVQMLSPKLGIAHYLSPVDMQGCCVR